MLRLDKSPRRTGSLYVLVVMGQLANDATPGRGQEFCPLGDPGRLVTETQPKKKKKNPRARLILESERAAFSSHQVNVLLIATPSSPGEARRQPTAE